MNNDTVVEKARLSNGKRLLLSMLAIVSAAALTGLGAFAAWTDTATVSHTASSGTLDINLGATGTGENRLDLGYTNLKPGDTYSRAVDVKNDGTVTFGTYTLTTAATASSVLDTDTTNGLQMVSRRCSVAWTESGTAPNYSYTCGGTETVVGASAPIIQTNSSLGTAPAPAGVDHLVVDVTLPSASNNSTQGQSSTISYTFNAAQ